MIIRDTFLKSIERDIKGVIKVGQDDTANIRQELSEYVVTRELQRHFADFFSAYKKGIVGNTDKMGVWISGFFGSGKSHFLKILSYLLSDRVVDGKKAIQYFIDDHKIRDNMVLADMKLASDTSTDVILFNIDSKGEVNGKQDKDAIVSVFFKVFNEMQGFCGAIPFLADLERKLTEDGRYEEFVQSFEEINGESWKEARNDFDFIQDDVVEALSSIGFMREEAARNWCEKAAEPYSISIERFADLVRRYIEKKGNNHHVVFLVDEIGQYIGDDTKLMLNLQTITEDLGTACGGKAWIIVTSQQDIDSVTKTKGNDFSKITGRFDTRLSLSSANVDEVIKKRILQKNEAGQQSLELLYDQCATIVKNLIIFDGGAEKKLYSTRENFADVYPFIPYQFNLLGSVLTSIRTHGASGKHLAEGERSMLALFKESASRLRNNELGKLVPFNMFYDALEQFLDHSHRGVIIHALDNDMINPNHEDDCFDVNVLKTLFMIKYVKEMPATLENVASLLVQDINEDRLELLKRVEDALKRLIRQTLVQKTGEVYVFLTNEEQEINREIERMQVEQSELITSTSELIFDGIYDEKKFRYPAFNGRYIFPFNQMVDDRPYKANQSADITLHILTPYCDESTDESTLRMMSGQSQCVLVVLPEDAAFLEEIRASKKIEKFLQKDALNTATKYEQLKDAKRSEKRKHDDDARLFLEEALKASTIYVGGDKAQSSGKDIRTRINEALGKLIAGVYHKLTYIDKPMGEAELRTLLRSSSNQLKLDLGGEATCNALALNDVRDYIALNSSRKMKTSLKSVMDRFTKAPYGFIEADIWWLVGKLFKNGEVAFFINSEAVTLLTKSVDEIVRFITRKEYYEKLMLDKKERPGEKQIKSVREIMKELFHVTPTSDDEDGLMQSFHNYAANLKSTLEKLEIHYQTQPAYPGKALIATGKKLMNDATQMRYSTEFFAGMDQRRDDYFDFAEDYEPLKSFFEGDQKAIFDKTLLLLGIFDDSKNFIAKPELDAVVKEMRRIVRMDKPYNEIYKLPGLNKQFSDMYDAILDALLVPVQEVIAAARKRVFDELNGKCCHDKLVNRFIERFEEISRKAESCNNVATLQNIKIEADALKTRLLNEIATEEAKMTPPPQPQKNDDEHGETPVVVPPQQKKKKTVSIKEITAYSSWQIETEEDVRRYVSELQKKLMDKLENNTVIHIEF